MTHRSSKSVHRCDLCAARVTKIPKTKNKRKKPYSGKNRVFAETTHVAGLKSNFAWCTGDFREAVVSCKFRVLSKSVQQFQRCAHWLVQAAMTSTSWLADGEHNSRTIGSAVTFQCDSRPSVRLHLYRVTAVCVRPLGTLVTVQPTSAATVSPALS